MVLYGLSFSPLKAERTNPPEIYLPQPIFKIGSVGQDTTVGFDFPVLNTGKSDLVIEMVRSSCECLEIVRYPEKIPPNQAFSIQLDFITEGIEGDFKKYFYIHTNDEDDPIVRVEVRGRVVESKPASAPIEVSIVEASKGDIVKKEALESGRVRLIFFSSLSCRECTNVKNRLVLPLVKRYKDKLDIEILSIADMDNYYQLISLEEEFGKKGAEIPALLIIPPKTKAKLVSTRFLSGKEEIEKNLGGIIAKIVQPTGVDSSGIRDEKLGKGEDIYSKSGESKADILARFQRFGFWTVLGAGLLDGVNPCAFATIIFFVSFLTFAGFKRGEIFLVGIMFMLAVFLAYLAIGIGIFNFLYQLEGFSVVSNIVFYLIMLLAISLGIISLYDYMQYKKSGDSSKIILQLPSSIKRIIHKTIREKMDRGKYSTGIRLGVFAFISGLIVSILESVCTGQVYLPTIVFVLKMSNMKGAAVSYLFIYNLMFILPLGVILGLTLVGTRTNIFADFASKNLGIVKLLTALLFFFLAFMLTLTM